jgi:hypothetical protein
MNATATIAPTVVHDSSATRLPGCVACLHTVVSQDHAGADIEVLEEASSITLADSPRGLAWRLPGDLWPTERRTLADEFAAFVNRERRGPFVLERLLLRGRGRAVHVEVSIFPVDECEQRDLAELLGDERDPDGGRDLAALYVADIQAAWVERTSGTSLPVCFVEDLHRRPANHTIARQAA